MSILAQNKPGIYCITNTLNGKFYIGSSVNVKKRMANYLKLLQQNKHHSKHLQSSFNKHGQAAFLFSRLLYCENHELIRYEQYFIDKLHPNYNKRPNALNGLGSRHSDATRQRLREIHLGTHLSQIHKENIRLSLIGNTNRRGKPASEITKEKIKNSLIGNTRHKGIPISTETKEKMSISQKLAWVERRKQNG